MVTDAPKAAKIKKKGLGTEFWVKTVLITISLLYLGLVLFFPVANVVYAAFEKGVEPFLEALKIDDFISALQLTVLIAGIVLPLNTVFGLCAAWVIARNQFWGRTLLISIIDLPFSISPVVVGLMIVLLYGRNGWLGPFLEQNNLKIIFSTPGIVIATIVVTMPFVAREVIPVLEEVGTSEEEAARVLGATDWQIFWRVTIPNIRWGLLYGLLLTNARAMGEFGAVSVVSGNLAGLTQTLPLYVEEAYKNYQSQEAFAASLVLGLLALVTLVLKEVLERKTGKKNT
ncbi:sulfate ABC transporter, permease protein CysW [Synechococcus sp. PCC 7502]|uniref:sulfate ABC transporter permease subunit CysW n=1 Tax=Synechococcus sp. PCC 7502 TaxID=1173263 RepID=UPI00029FE2E9|nr:sulfate ABC transporter permease subunit CysW [Synechococcus sp. PCC 7502]AFY72407.1 sulfate ABC transporter, permease protein CysW [Synechococcus sp. PCC 7502]